MAMRDRQTGLYLSDAMNNLGEMTDYAVNTWKEIFLRRCRLAVPAQKGGHVTGFPKLSLFSSGQRRTKRTAL